MKLIFAILLVAIFSTDSVVLANPVLDFQAQFEEHGSIMLIIDPETGRIVFANNAAEEFYDFPNIEEMTIQQINTLTPEEVESERLAAANEDRSYFVFRHRLASGEIRTVEVYSYPFAMGEQTLLFSIIFDSTEKFLMAEREQTRIRSNYILLLVSITLLVLFVILLILYIVRSKQSRIKIQEAERRISAIVSNIRGMVYRSKNDEYWTMDYLSDGVKEVTGFSRVELLGNAVIDYNRIIDEEHRQRVRKDLKTDIEEDKKNFEYEYTITTKDGVKKWVLERGQVIYADSGEIQGFEGIVTDITTVRMSEQKAEEYRKKLYATIHSAGDAIIATDKNLVVELMNQEAERITGWSIESALGEKFEDVFQIVDESTREKQENPAMLALAEQRVVHLSKGTLLISKDGTEFPIDDSASPIWDADGNGIGCVVVFRDNTEKHKKEKDLEYVSFHDYLTGLYNRRFFEEELKRLDNNRNLPMSVMLIDANGLKLINDAYGHEEGDELIKAVSNVLKSVCRQNDIVARYGGDEFIILLLKSDESVAEIISDRITRALKQCKVRDVEISVSIGWDTKETFDVDLRDTIRNAENRMYQNKELYHSSNRRTIARRLLDGFSESDDNLANREKD